MIRHTLARHAAVGVARTARALDRLVARLSLLAVPPPAVMERAVVADGIAQGRADLQLVHTSDGSDWPELREAIRDAADADLRRRAEAIRDGAIRAGNRIAERRAQAMWPVGPHSPGECLGSGCPTHDPIRSVMLPRGYERP